MKELQQSLELCGGRLQNLNENYEQLSKQVTRVDSFLLNRRLEMLKKMWTEIVQQSAKKQQQLVRRLQLWTEFNDKCKQLLESMLNLDAAISSNKEIQIEDFIVKLQTVSRRKFTENF